MLTRWEYYANEILLHKLQKYVESSIFLWRSLLDFSLNKKWQTSYSNWRKKVFTSIIKISKNSNDVVTYLKNLRRWLSFLNTCSDIINSWIVIRHQFCRNTNQSMIPSLQLITRKNIPFFIEIKIKIHCMKFIMVLIKRCYTSMKINGINRE